MSPKAFRELLAARGRGEGGRQAPVRYQMAPAQRKGPGEASAASGTAASPCRGANALERDYAAHLGLRQAAGEVLWYAYEPFRLRLAEGAWFTPDFMVQVRSGLLEAHETKGWMREAARVRLRVAAAHYPFRFVLVRRDEGRWEYEGVPGAFRREES